MADDVVERVTDELLADLIRQGECHARGSAFLSIFRELQERRRSPSPDAEAAKREAIEALELIEADLAAGNITPAFRVKFARSRTEAWLKKLRALSPPVEGE